MGRALLCAPYFATAVLAAGAVMNAGTESEKQAFLPGIAAGETTATIACEQFDGSPNMLRCISADDVRWLIQEVVPIIEAAKQPPKTNGAASGNGATNHADNSRSARAMRRMTKLWHDGDVDTLEDVKKKLLNDPEGDIREWTQEDIDHPTLLERQLRRAWEKAKTRPRDIDRIRREIAEMDREDFIADACSSAAEECPVVESEQEPETLKEPTEPKRKLLGFEHSVFTVIEWTIQIG
jgi:hypothetical protein